VPGIQFGELASLDATVWQLVFLGVSSLAIGILAGMVGVALGIIRLPLMLALGFNPVISAGTNLGVSILGGATASWPHWRGGRVVFRIVLVFGIPAIVGSFLGGLFADDLRAWVLLAVIAIILGIAALIIYRQYWEVAHPPLRPVRHRPPVPLADPTGVSNIRAGRAVVDGGIGFGIGAIGGAVGMVLGSLRLPLLMNVLKMDPKLAVGTNNAIGVLAGLSGFFGHVLNTNFDIEVMLVMGIAGMAGSYVGANQTERVDANRLRLLVALMLTSVTPFVAYRAFAEFPG
jgi:uncharacterized membrane protein YfcA